LQRGRYELAIADRFTTEFGVDGMAILDALAKIDDGIVAKMCEQEHDGTLTLDGLRSALRLAEGAKA
jgi:hypothetical protein